MEDGGKGGNDATVPDVEKLMADGGEAGVDSGDYRYPPGGGSVKPYQTQTSGQRITYLEGQHIELVHRFEELSFRVIYLEGKLRELLEDGK